MNRRDKDVLLALYSREYTGQRDLADALGCSLGAVNGSVKTLISEGYIDREMHLTEKSREHLKESAPKRAVLLAAGFGLRKYPINAESPKALLEVGGEPLIDRIIKQLRSVGISEIYAVVGFAKEQFEYLMDSYGVELIVNPGYAEKNNLHSLYLAREHLKNCYVVPCDMWCRENPFRSAEQYSWYMVSREESRNSAVRVNRKQELAVVQSDAVGNTMIGISYLLGDDADIIRRRLTVMDPDRRYEGSFWEETLYEGDKFLIGPRVVEPDEVTEINTIEDLWELDSPRGLPLSEVAYALGVNECGITDITVMKKGMTNRSVQFTCKGERYIMRIADDGVNKLMDRSREAAVYKAIAGCSLADDAVYLNSGTGLKISRYIDSVRTCDPLDPQDVKTCMTELRKFHGMGLTVEHELDLFGTIEYFETLWDGAPSVYRDYNKTKENVFSLRSYIDGQPKDRCLTHIDPVPENFLITPDGGGVRLIDWEYAAMQDPHLDIAMFALYSLYNKAQLDSLIDAYFPEGCVDAVRLKIYCYMAVGGLLWSNWCEYKHKCGTEFGEYSLRQYRYAKDFYRIVSGELGNGGI